jgi:hypothetical protein
MAEFCDFTLVHYSAARLGEIKSFDQPERLSPYGKPKGLWVAVESHQDDWNGWREWCEREQSALDKFEYAVRIHLWDDANVQLISGAAGIIAFHEQFGRTIPEHLADRSRCIDWKYVARSYSGVIIAPYVWELRAWMKPSWYYAWHCTSGCIWDATAIRLAEALSSFKKPALRSRYDRCSYSSPAAASFGPAGIGRRTCDRGPY